MTVVCGIANPFFLKGKVKRATFSKSFNHYTVNEYLQELQKINFSNYERFSCIDAAYNDFLNKLMKVVNEIVPSKEIKTKNNTARMVS